MHISIYIYIYIHIYIYMYIDSSQDARRLKVKELFCRVPKTILLDRRFAFPSTNHPKNVDNRPIFRLFIYLYRDFL